MFKFSLGFPPWSSTATTLAFWQPSLALCWGWTFHPSLESLGPAMFQGGNAHRNWATKNGLLDWWYWWLIQELYIEFNPTWFLNVGDYSKFEPYQGKLSTIYIMRSDRGISNGSTCWCSGLTTAFLF
jgi:hypothetical protein